LAGHAFWEASSTFDRGDKANCQALLTFALALDPELPSRPEWAGFRWKRRFGPRLWSLLRPVVDRLRRRSVSIAAPK
jgi:hypothetical protein